MVDVYQEIIPSLVLDTEAQNRSIEELKDVPHYQLEELFLQHKLDLTVDGVVLGGMGNDSIGFKIGTKEGEKQFLKVFRIGLIPQPIMMDFLQKSGVRIENMKKWDGSNLAEEEFQETLKDWTYSVLGEEDVRERKNFIEAQAMGIKKGNQLLPNRIPKLQAIWTWNGEPVAMTTEFKDGKGEPITKWDEEYSKDIELLERNGIHVDAHGGSDNAIRDKNNDVWFIDLNYYPENSNP